MIIIITNVVDMATAVAVQETVTLRKEPEDANKRPLSFSGNQQ